MTDDPARYGNANDREAAYQENPESGPRHVGVAEAKGTFSALIEGVQHRGEHYVIERHGKPAAALVSVEELESLEADRLPAPGRTGGAPVERHVARHPVGRRDRRDGCGDLRGPRARCPP